jgi:GT2 family glycosyltransferase
MDISVVIVNWNTKDFLEQCLDSLSMTPSARSTEIIVVDNASSDGSVEMVEGRFPQVKLIRSDENLGFARGNNLGIQHSSGRYISLINSDVKVLPGCMDSLADYLDRNPAVGNVGPRILNSDLTLQSSSRRFPTLWNNLCSATGLATAFKGSRFFSGEHMLFFPHDRIMAVDVLVGCFWMLRKEVIKEVGLLDESFFMYGEDVDWCRRCWNAGWQIVFLPNAQAIHYRGGSSGTQVVRLAVVQQSSVFHYWSKHKNKLGLLGIKSILFCHHAIRYVFGMMKHLFQPSEASKADVRMRISSACLEVLLSGPGRVRTEGEVRSSTP